MRRTKDLLLVYRGDGLKLEGYTYSSFQSDCDDSKSNSGYVYTLNGGAISWKSCKQDTIADSTTEVEYIVAAKAAKEVIWMKKFITELRIVPSCGDTVTLHCDNNDTINLIWEQRSHQKS